MSETLESVCHARSESLIQGRATCASAPVSSTPSTVSSTLPSHRTHQKHLTPPQARWIIRTPSLSCPHLKDYSPISGRSNYVDMPAHLGVWSSFFHEFEARIGRKSIGKLVRWSREDEGLVDANNSTCQQSKVRRIGKCFIRWGKKHKDHRLKGQGLRTRIAFARSGKIQTFLISSHPLYAREQVEDLGISHCNTP